MKKIPLTENEINFVKSKIQRIQADESIFIFNDEDHIKGDTCYNFGLDKIFITKNVFPDKEYGSIHPRDLMSVGAVLAHEYYGHRPNREEYLKDIEKGINYHTIPIWQDECRASINATRVSPGLSQMDKSYLVMDAIYRAQEAGTNIKTDDFMKEVLYGYSENEKHFQPIVYVSKESQKRNDSNWGSASNMSKMQGTPNCINEWERE